MLVFLGRALRLIIDLLRRRHVEKRLFGIGNFFLSERQGWHDYFSIFLVLIGVNVVQRRLILDVVDVVRGIRAIGRVLCLLFGSHL